VITSLVVTLWYRAPEVLLQSSYASSVDIWSCACIFYELFKRQPLFEGNSEADQLRKIFEVIGSPDERDWPKELNLPYATFSKFKPTPISSLLPEICPEGCHLLEKMLKFDFKNRITAAESLQHPYFKEYELYPPIINDKSSNQTSTTQINSRRPPTTSRFPFTTNNSTLKNKVI